MSDYNNNIILEKDPIPAPTPFGCVENQNENESYTCSKCSADIEVLSIDNDEKTIKFKCLNNNIENNHKIQTMLIREYIKNMVKYTYLYDECSNCHIRQNSFKNIKIFKYCTSCKIIVCNECLRNHLKNKNIEHFLINNNEKKIKCLIHPKNNFITYCFDCKKHLCEECLLTRKHIIHRKALISECLLSKEERSIHNKIIDLLKNKKNNLEKQNENKIKELFNLYNEENKTIETNFNDLKILNEQNLKKELDLNEHKLISDLDELKRKYDEDVKSKKDENKKNVKEINEKYRKLKEQNEKIYKENLINNEYKYNENVKNLEFKRKINDINDLISINEILKKTQEKYENNYYYSINIINILSNYSKSDKDEIMNLFNKNIILKLNNNIFSQNELNTKEIIDKLKFENNNLKNANMNNRKIDINIENKNNYNIGPNSKLNYFDIIEDSYCPTDVENTFTIFYSFNNMIYLVYTTKSNSINFYNLLEEKIEKKINISHSSNIINLRYCYNSNINKEILMSISYKNRNLKLWDINNLECLLNLENIYTKGFIYSGCFFQDTNNYYIAVSSRIAGEKTADIIKIYDFNGNKIKDINNSNDNVFIIDSYSSKKDIYIIIGSKGFLKSYDYNKNILYFKYETNKDSCIFSFQIFESKEIIKLIGSCDDGILRIWGFHSGNLLKKYEISKSKLRSICLLNENFVFVGCLDNTIKLIEINEEGKNIMTLSGHNDKVCTVKKIILPKYGECIFSQGFDDSIKIWKKLN